MANNTNAYATVNPLQGNVSDWVTNQENLGLRYREEQRQIDALDEARKDKEQARKDKLKKDILGNLPKNYDTGSISLNELNGRAIQKGIDRKFEIYKELQRQDLDDTTRLKLELESKNIDNLPENLKIATDQFSGLLKDYQTGVATNKYFRNADFEKKALNGFDNYIIGLDNGLPMVGFTDRNGDGVVNDLDVISYEGLLKGDVPWKFQKQYDLDAMAAADAKNTGYDDITTYRDFVKTQEKKPRINQIEARAEALVRNPDGTATEAALSQLRKMGLDSTPDNLNKVKQYYADAVLRNTDYKKAQDVDWAAKNAADKEARLAAKGSGKQTKVYTINDLSPTAKTVTTKGGKVQETLDNIYQGNVKIERKAGNATETFRGFSVDKNGDISVIVDIPVKTESGNYVSKRKYSSKDDADIVSYFATRFQDPSTGEYIKTLPQLREKLQSLGGSNNVKVENQQNRTTSIGAYDNLGQQ